MVSAIRSEVIDSVRAAAHPLTGSDRDYDPLLELVGDRRYVAAARQRHQRLQWSLARIGVGEGRVQQQDERSSVHIARSRQIELEQTMPGDGVHEVRVQPNVGRVLHYTPIAVAGSGR